MIKLYIGNLGAGKTLHMVKDLMEEMKKGRTVISNTPIIFKYKGKIFQSITISNADNFLKAVVNAWNCIIAIDELAVFFPAHMWSEMPAEVTYKLAQSRHMGVDLYGTTQGLSHTIKRLRDLTNLVVECSPRLFWLPMPVFPEIILSNGKKSRDFDYIRPIVYEGHCYAPDLYNHSIVDPKTKKMFEIYHDKIYPSTARRVFEAYNTMFRVKGNAMGDLKLEDDYKPVSDDNFKLVNQDFDISNRGKYNN